MASGTSVPTMRYATNQPWAEYCATVGKPANASMGKPYIHIISKLTILKLRKCHVRMVIVLFPTSTRNLLHAVFVLAILLLIYRTASVPAMADRKYGTTFHNFTCPQSVGQQREPAITRAVEAMNVQPFS